MKSCLDNVQINDRVCYYVKTSRFLTFKINVVVSVTDLVSGKGRYFCYEDGGYDTIEGLINSSKRGTIADLKIVKEKK